MNFHEFDNSASEINYSIYSQFETKNRNLKKRINGLKLWHKILDNFNISLIFLIFILSFVAFNSQREWTLIYSNLMDIRNKNNNLIDYISKTEEHFIKEMELSDDIKETTSKDLIYLDKPKKIFKSNLIKSSLENMFDGFEDSKNLVGY